MSNEQIVVVGTPKTLEANGSSITNNSVVQADDATYSISADGSNYPDAEFVLTGTFSVAPTEGAALSLYARPLDIDGTADTEVPEAARPTLLIGNFTVNNVTTSQSMILIGQDVPRKADYYVHNNGTGQTLGTGWTLKVTPISLGAAA